MSHVMVIKCDKGMTDVTVIVILLCDTEKNIKDSRTMILYSINNIWPLE